MYNVMGASSSGGYLHASHDYSHVDVMDSAFYCCTHADHESAALDSLRTVILRKFVLIPCPENVLDLHQEPSFKGHNCYPKEIIFPSHRKKKYIYI